MELPENLKLQLDTRSGEAQPDRLSRAPDTDSPGASGSAIPESGGVNSGESGPIDEAESQMRKALGLLGDPSRHRPDAERMEQPARMSDRFNGGGFNGGLHRRRFVQDGDIPVTVLRRDQGHEAPAHRGMSAPAAPTSSRLQRTEAALAAETAARERAERSLSETQSVVRDLQTKIGHAELAKNEAVDALRREREALAELRSEGDLREERFQEALEQARGAERNLHTCQEQLTEERHARNNADKALRAAEAARESAEQLVQALSQEMPAPPRAPQPIGRPRAVAEPEVVVPAPRRGRPPGPVAVVAEPEPVKWWLNTKAAGKKR
jgi:hypothetical protein